LCQKKKFSQAQELEVMPKGKGLAKKIKSCAKRKRFNQNI
jgi:hypothetical protein